MREILDEAVRRQSMYQVQYTDYEENQWTVKTKMNEARRDAILADGSIRRIYIEFFL